MEIPSLISFVLKRGPDETSFGLTFSSSEDGRAVEVYNILPDSPASRTPLQQGCEILSVNDHRVASAMRCAKMLKHYGEREADITIVASVGRRPSGALYVLVKHKKHQGRTKPERSRGNDSNIDGEDGIDSPTVVEGLQLEMRRGRVRVAENIEEGDESGIFSKSGIKKGDEILSIHGRKIQSIADVKRSVRKADLLSVPVLKYNSFVKLRFSFGKKMSPIELGIGNSKEIKSVNGIGNEKKSDEPATKNGSRRVGDLYTFGKLLGTGTLSTVRKCTLKETRKVYAVKIVSRKNLDKTKEEMLSHEVSILESLKHRNILCLHDIFVTPTSFYLMTEYLEGGELFDRLVAKTTYTEGEARAVCKVLFEAMAFCHSKKIAHRDLKPENLLLQFKDSDSELKIADFGFARKAATDYSLVTVCGSPGYVSPEILLGEPYGTKTDMWSLGVIVFILLGGYPPFVAETTKEQLNNIKCGKFEFEAKQWKSLPEKNGVKSLISALLNRDPAKRISAEEALQHPWMKCDGKQLCLDSLSDILREFRLYNAKRKFKQAALSVTFMNKLDSDLTGGDAVFAGKNKFSSLPASALDASVSNDLGNTDV